MFSCREIAGLFTLKAGVPFLEASRDVGAPSTEDAHDKTLQLPRTLSEIPAIARSEHLPRTPLEGDASHIDRAKEALERGKIRYQIVGGIGSHGQVWGHATFLVESLPSARILLCRAGFLPSSDSEYVLIDSQNGWKIRLLGKE